MAVAEWISRLNRFVPRACRSLRRDLASGARSAAHNVVAAWRSTDPKRAERLHALFTPNPEMVAAGKRRKQELEEAWELLAEQGSVVYEGELYARPVMRGLLLDDMDGQPDVAEWLADVVGLDDVHGNVGRRVRLTVEPLDPSADPPNTDA